MRSPCRTAKETRLVTLVYTLVVDSGVDSRTRLVVIVNSRRKLVVEHSSCSVAFSSFSYTRYSQLTSFRNSSRTFRRLHSRFDLSLFVVEFVDRVGHLGVRALPSLYRRLAQYRGRKCRRGKVQGHPRVPADSRGENNTARREHREHLPRVRATRPPRDEGPVPHRIPRALPCRSRTIRGVSQPKGRAGVRGVRKGDNPQSVGRVPRTRCTTAIPQPEGRGSPPPGTPPVELSPGATGRKEGRRPELQLTGREESGGAESPIGAHRHPRVPREAPLRRASSAFPASLPSAPSTAAEPIQGVSTQVGPGTLSRAHKRYIPRAHRSGPAAHSRTAWRRRLPPRRDPRNAAYRSRVTRKLA